MKHLINPTSNQVMNKRIEDINTFIMAQELNKIPLGLFSGQMGICIYFYHQARLYKNKEYEEFAEKLLDNIYQSLHTNISYDFENGLAGICYGINYLIDHNFVEGNVNSILSDLDDQIYAKIVTDLLSDKTNVSTGHINRILGIIVYFCKRLENPKLSSNNRYVFENLIIKLINAIEHNINGEKYIEPYYFSIIAYNLPIYLFVLCRVHQLGFYNYKVDRILNELSNKLKITYPLLQSNRMFLSIAMRSVTGAKPNLNWHKHISVLEKDIDIDKVISNEFKNKNIFFHDGVTGFAYLLSEFEYKPITDYKLLLYKIEQSNMWDEYLNDENGIKAQIGLINGFCGVILMYQKLLNLA